MVMRLIDFLKLHHVTCVFTSLTHGGEIEQTDIGIRFAKNQRLRWESCWPPSSTTSTRQVSKPAMRRSR